MQFSSKIRIFSIFLFLFSGIQTIHASENGDGEQIILLQEGPETLESFTQRIKEELGDDEDLKKNLDSLIEAITPAINELNYEGVSLSNSLLNNKYKLGAYFEEVVKNAIKYKYEFEHEYEYEYIAPYKNILPFIDPVDKKFNDKLIFPYEISNPEASHLIFDEFFKIFFFRSKYPDDKNSVPYHVLKHFLANLAIFAFDDKKTMQDMTDSIRILHEQKYKDKDQQKTNKIFEAFIDGAVRLYAYRIKGRTDLLNKASRTQKMWMQTKAFFKTPISDNTIVFLAQQWSNVDLKACEQYLNTELPQSLKAYDLEDQQAKKTSENIKIKAIGTLWQKHKYKILAGIGVGILVASGIVALKLDQKAREELKKAREELQKVMWREELKRQHQEQWKEQLKEQMRSDFEEQMRRGREEHWKRVFEEQLKEHWKKQ